MVNARPAANLNNRCYELDASVIAAIKVELCTLQRAAGPRGLRGPLPRLSLPLRSTGHQWDARPKTQFRRRLAAGAKDSNSGSHPRATPPAATRFVADSALRRPRQPQGSLLTPRWRKPDSNPRSPGELYPLPINHQVGDRASGEKRLSQGRRTRCQRLRSLH
jgi:hypothetical protein